LEDCKIYGTLPFSNLARFGFIGSIFLKSLLEKEIVSKSEYDNFFQSIHTIAKEFLEDFNLLILKEITKEEFLAKYGHLRPGTYDITSLSYQEGFDDYIDSNAKVNKSKSYKFDFSDEILNEISKEISNHNLSFNVEQLLTFIIKATEAREKAKFEFTKSLSAVLDLIEELGGEYGIDKDKLSYLNLDEILKYKNTTCRVNFEKHIKQNILINKDKYLITSAILLPELILSEQDIEMFFYPSSKPNFVSQHKIDSEIIFLKDNNQSSIDNKIVLIENADPGFDWIFSHNIKGLVTKYGGAASHMAIRCAEFDLPAAIGCGDKIFNDLVNYKKITLDCINQKIEGIY
jgi:phosphohistidine swiveling domain-containing protein